MAKPNPIEDYKDKVENKVIDWIASRSGHLLASKLDNKLDVVDIVVKQRAEYKDPRKILLEIKDCVKDLEKGVYRMEMSSKDFDQSSESYIIFLHFNLVIQDIEEYFWIVPADKFIEVAKTEEKTFKFEAPINFETENYYSRFLVNKETLAKVLEKILEEGNKFVFPEFGFTNFNNVKLDKLKEFIVEARTHTFAGNAVPSDAPRLMGSKELGYQKGDWFYQDIYFNGKNRIIGQEVVYYNTKPVWSMAYFGDQLEEKPTIFLKYVLNKLADKCRFGGECQANKKEFVYQDKGEGTLEKFFGQEKISAVNKDIYKLNYFGGVISK